MKLTTKGKYGLRVMLDLALNHGNGPILADNIAARQDISGNYIHVLVTFLRKAGLVRTVRGPNGGYELRQDPRDISVLQIIEALEGHPWGECPDETDGAHIPPAASVREIWCETVRMVETFLSRRTLADLVKKELAIQEAQLMYHI